MKSIKILAAAAALAALTATAGAEETTWTKGEIKNVDLAQSKITVKHEPIVNLDMPSMTMVFFAPDKTVLQGLEAGQKKEFEFVDMNGRVVVKQVR